VDQLAERMQVEFAHDVGAMGLYRLDAEVEEGGNLLLKLRRSAMGLGWTRTQ
jgi:hypothetical protein